MRLPAHPVMLEALVKIRASPRHSAPLQVSTAAATVIAALAMADTAADTAARTGTGIVAAGTAAGTVADTGEGMAVVLRKMATGPSAHATAPWAMVAGPLEVVFTAVALSAPLAEESIQTRTPCRLAFAISRICW